MEFTPELRERLFGQARKFVHIDSLFTYPCAVRRVVDGDTLDLIIDLGFGLTLKHRVRLLGVDTPEIRGPERPRGIVAAEFVGGWVYEKGENAIKEFPLIVGVRKIGRPEDKYGRYLGYIVNPLSGESLNDRLIENGYAEKP